MFKCRNPAGLKCCLMFVIGMSMASFNSSKAQAAECVLYSGPCYGVDGYAGYTAQNGGDEFNHDDTVLSASANYSGNGQSASAAVDLEYGTVRLAVDAVSGITARGRFIDTLQFDLPDGMVSYDLPVSFTIEGVNTYKSISAAFNNIYSNFLFAAGEPYQGVHQPSLIFGQACGPQASQQAFTEALCKEGPVSFTFDGTITLYEGINYYVGAELFIGGRHIIEDFSNTATFSWELPDEITYTSASGAFLTGVPSRAVPEPSTWAMMLLGFGLIGSAIRARRCAMPKVRFAL